MSQNKWEKVQQEMDEQQQAEQHDVDQQVDNDLEQASTAELLAQIEQLTEEQDVLRNQMLGAQAELQNVRKRADRDVEQAHKYGTKKLLQDLLPVLDSLVRASEGVDASNPTIKPLIEGVDLTTNMLESALVKHGVEMIDPELGTPFNPETMEAMSMVPNPEFASNTVMQVLQKGYALNERVIRAAMVIVAQ